MTDLNERAKEMAGQTGGSPYARASQQMIRDLVSANCDLQAKLIERDGEVERLNEDNRRLLKDVDVAVAEEALRQKDCAEAAEAECARMSEALEWYSDEENYKKFECGPNEDFWGAGHTEGETAFAVATHADFCEEPWGVARQALSQPSKVAEAERRVVVCAVEWATCGQRLLHVEKLENACEALAAVRKEAGNDV